MLLFPPPFRYRSNTDFKVIDFVWQNWSGTNTNPAAMLYANDVSYNWRWVKYESILDYPRLPNVHIAPNARVRPIQHVKISVSNTQPVVQFLGLGGDPVTPVTDATIIRPSHIFDVVVPSVSDPVRRKFWKDSFTAFSDQFPEEISLANFFIELKDLAPLAEKVERGIKLLHQNRNKLNSKALNSAIKGKWKDTDVPKASADAFLQYQFNVKPLLGDLATLSTLVKLVMDRIDYLKRTHGKPTRLRHAERGPEIPRGSVYLDQGLGGTMVEYRVIEYKCRFNAVAMLLQTMTHLDDVYGMFRSFVGTAGLSNPLKIAWNAIPFSFVTDWFVDVSSYLEAFEVQAADSNWNVYDVTNSVKQTALIEAYQVDRLTKSRLRKLGDLRFERYERLTGLPVSLLDLPVFEALNTKQLALVLAMSTK